MAADQGERRARQARAEGTIVDERPESVASGRTLEEIAADPDRVWESKKSVAENVKRGAVKKKKARRSTSQSQRRGQGAMPDFVEPELATLVKEAPPGGEWVHEMKLDGYRMLCRDRGRRGQMISRNGKDWTGISRRRAVRRRGCRSRAHGSTARSS